MKNILLLSSLTLMSTLYLKAGTFSSIASGNWNDPTKWTIVGDVDGIPDSDDDITINAHTITVNIASAQCRDISVAVGGTLDLQRPLTINGHYTQNGTETGSASLGGLYFAGAGKNISGSGTINNAIKYVFLGSCTRTILAGCTIVKTAITTIYSNISITNFGSLTVIQVNKATGGVTGYSFTNGANATLTLKARNFFAGGTFTCSAAGNTVRINYSSDPFPICVGGTYYNVVVVSPNSRLAENTIVTNDLSINASGGLATSTFNLTIGHDFTRAGIWTPSAGFTVTMNGSAAQTITNSAVSTMQFQSLVITNPVSVTLASGTYQILNNLTVSSGTFNAASRPVTFISDVSTTAVLGTVGGTATITNATNFAFQRFIDARAAGYSDMSGCVAGQLLTDWDDDLLLVYVYSPPSYFPSVYGYDETAWDYIPITSSSQSLDPGVGFEVYLDSDGNQVTFNATTITQTGAPNFGDVDMSGYITFANDGWNLIGNPYHANLDWDALFATTSGVAADLLVYDEVAQDFVTVFGGAGELLAPEQGFWVNATSGSPTFVFSESTKSTSTSSTFRNSNKSLFEVRLKSLGGTGFTSGTSFRFSPTPELVEQSGNLPFKKAPHPNAPLLCSKSEAGKDLKINLLNSTQDEISIPLKYKANVSGIYLIESINTEMANMEGYSCVTLFDSKLNRTIDIATENYQFYAEEGDAENRFSLKLSKNGNCGSSVVAEASNAEVNINRVGENTLVRLDFENETSATITMTDLLGQKLTPSKVVVGTTQDVYLPIPADFGGIYMVSVSYNNKIETRKLYK